MCMLPQFKNNLKHTHDPRASYRGAYGVSLLCCQGENRMDRPDPT